MRVWICLLLVVACGCLSARGDFDLNRLPNAQDVAAIRTMGWKTGADSLEAKLAQAWTPSNFAQAGSTGNMAFRQWQLLYQWSRLLGTSEMEILQDFLGRRVLQSPNNPQELLILAPGLPLPRDNAGRLLPTAVEKLSAKRVPPEILQGLLPDDYTPQDGDVSLRAKEDFLAALAMDTGFLQEFFRLLTPDDFVPMVLTRLEQLHLAHPTKWSDYRSLILAFALVYDQRRPMYWPHHQVKPEAVQKMDEPLAERLGYYIQKNDARRLEFDLRRMSSEQLKFVVDAEVPRSELEWATKNVRFGKNQFDRVFRVVNYDRHRVERGAFVWPHGRYLLPNILLEGGICVDQAYFSTIAGKAKGIPTIYFAGQGTDGGHAWFGYLQGNGKWDLDAGRYINQNYTVGQALDPQTWLPITDHELLYLSGTSQRSTRQDAALGDLEMAKIFAQRKDVNAQLAAATSALYNAPEYLPAWEAKEAALSAAGDHAGLRELFSNAIKTFSRQNDLKVRYQTRLAELERAGGNTLAAQKLSDQMVRENRRQRADLSASAGAEILIRLLEKKDYDGAMREFKKLVDRLGRTGGGNLFYEVVRPFVLELRRVGREQDAQRAIKRAKDKMLFESDSILAREFAELSAGQ